MRHWPLILVALLVLVLVDALILQPLYRCHYDGHADFAINVETVKPLDITKARCLILIHASDTSMYEQVSAKELWSWASPPESSRKGVMVVRAPFGGQGTFPCQTYHQAHGAILVFPLPQGSFVKHLYEFPDLREVDADTIAL